MQEEGDVIKVGLGDLELCYTKFCNEPDLELKSTILSTVSSLVVFLSLSRQRLEFEEAHSKLLLGLIESLFKCFSIDDGSSGLRHHVSSLMIKVTLHQ